MTNGQIISNEQSIATSTQQIPSSFSVFFFPPFPFLPFSLISLFSKVSLFSSRYGNARGPNKIIRFGNRGIERFTREIIFRIYTAIWYSGFHGALSNISRLYLYLLFEGVVRLKCAAIFFFRGREIGIGRFARSPREYINSIYYFLRSHQYDQINIQGVLSAFRIIQSRTFCCRVIADHTDAELPGPSLKSCKYQSKCHIWP